ncbi:GtrA family protein [Pseudoxanthomonas suwonensis]|uniref:GtrA family protein n=1 Tax=Pseudoxanthomonas suwonensis TaxID=314722 RepID=UPI00048BE607|nr:GtrA family protein [Pseudoxanthomonas suwonensis]
MTGPRLAALYVFFAVLSTLANIASQWITAQLAAGLRHEIYLSMVVGTIVGLVVKYALDKRWIFQYSTHDRLHDARTFLLYTAMGGLTTVVFWAMELAFDAFFEDGRMRYVGAAIGLGIGYLLKYRLDKRFVFVPVKDPSSP